MDIPLYVICCFSLVDFHIFSVFNFCKFDDCMFQHVPPWVNPVWDSACFLDLGDCFLSHDRRVFRYFFRPFLSLISFWDPCEANVGAFDQRFLKLSSFLSILLSLFCSVSVISSILSSSSLIHSSASFILLLIPSNVFLISVIVFFSPVGSLFIFSGSLLKTYCSLSHSV